MHGCVLSTVFRESTLLLCNIFPSIIQADIDSIE